MYPSNEITSADPACDQSGMMFMTPRPTRGRRQSFWLLGPNAKGKAQGITRVPSWPQQQKGSTNPPRTSELRN